MVGAYDYLNVQINDEISKKNNEFIYCPKKVQKKLEELLALLGFTLVFSDAIKIDSNGEEYYIIKSIIDDKTKMPLDIRKESVKCGFCLNKEDGTIVITNDSSGNVLIVNSSRLDDDKYVLSDISRVVSEETSVSIRKDASLCYKHRIIKPGTTRVGSMMIDGGLDEATLLPSLKFIAEGNRISEKIYLSNLTSLPDSPLDRAWKIERELNKMNSVINKYVEVLSLTSEQVSLINGVLNEMLTTSKSIEERCIDASYQGMHL